MTEETIITPVAEAANPAPIAIPATPAVLKEDFEKLQAEVAEIKALKLQSDEKDAKVEALAAQLKALDTALNSLNIKMQAPKETLAAKTADRNPLDLLNR